MNIPILLEAKNIYTEHLVGILAPFIYEGLSSIYQSSVEIAEGSGRPEKIKQIFLKLLESIDEWNQNRIEEETCRIRNSSGAQDYLDDLVKVVIRANIIILTYSNTVSNVIGQNFYDRLQTSKLIHQCYIECGKCCRNYPQMFHHDENNPLESRRNQILIDAKIQECLYLAIRKILPFSLFAKEFLVNTINFFNEAPKVELVGRSTMNQPMVQSMQQPIAQPTVPLIHPHISAKYEKDINKMIETEYSKPQEQKIQDLLMIDEILSSHSEITSKRKESEKQQNNFLSRSSLRGTSSHQPSPEKSPQRILIDVNALDDPEYPLPQPRSNRQSDNDSNRRMSSSRRHKQPNIFDVSSQKQYRERDNRPIESERVDPDKIGIIEDYGSGRNRNNIWKGY